MTQTNRQIGAVLAASVVGLLASLVLTLDVVRSAEDAAFTPSCNINPLLNCLSVMNSAQAEIMGVPNSLLGVVLFAVLATFSALVLMGATYKRWIWPMAQAGAIAGFIFTQYLIYVSIYVLGTICPWCFVVWHMVAVIAWGVTADNVKHRRLHIDRYAWTRRLEQWIGRYNTVFFIAWWVVIMALLIVQFGGVLL